MSEREVYRHNSLETLYNERFRLQELENHGHNMQPLLEKNWEKIVELIESEDTKKLRHLRSIMEERYDD